MALETGEYIGNLVATNPTPSDPKSQGDDHLRLIKSTLQNSFAGIEGMILVSGVESGAGNAYTVALSGEPTTPAVYTANMVVLFQATHANTGNCTLSVAGIAAAPLLDVNGNQLPANAILANSVIVATYIGTNFYLVSPAGMAPLTSPALVGTPTAPTPALTDNSTKIATTAFAVQLAFQAALPAQTGSAGKFLTTNGTAASWNYIGINNVLSTITTSTTLTGIYEFVPVAMSSAFQSITLPNATTLTLGGPMYVIRNTGSTTFVVRDNAGTLIATLNPRNTILVMLSDKSTSAGVWEIGNVSEWSELQQYYQDASNVLDATAIGTFGGVYQVSGSTYVAIYNVGSNVKGMLISIVGSTVTVLGSATLVTGGSINAYSAGISCVAVLSSTQFMLVYYNTSTTYANAVIVNISGTTMTPATPVVLAAEASTSSYLTCVPLSSTTAMVFWYQSGSTKQYAAVATVSGSTISLGAAFIIGTPGDIMATALSATSVLCVFNWSSYPSNNIFVLGVSGTTISVVGGSLNSTGNYPAPLLNTDATYGLLLVNSGLAFVVVYSSSTTYTFPVTISGGTTITIGTTVSLPAAIGAPTVGGGKIVFISPTQGYILTSASGGITITDLSLSGSLLTAGASVTLSSVSAASVSSWQQITDFLTLGFGAGASSYFSSQSIEVVK